MKNLKAIRFVLYYTMGINIMVTIVKLVVGYATGSLSLVADGFDSLFDSASNVIGLVGIYIASRPPDPGHPYGHRKYETLTAMSISILLFVTTIELLQSAIRRFRSPTTPEVNVWTFAALALSIGLHLYVGVYEKKRGEELKSEFLVADALHTRASVFVSVSVAVGMLMVRLGLPIADPILALIIAVLIAKIGLDIIRDASQVLVDAAVVDEEQVKRIIRELPGGLTFHRLRSRGQEDDTHLDLHVQVPQGMSVEQAHHLAHQVQRRLLEEVEGLRDVVVHVEPQEGVAPAEVDLGQRIREVAKRIPGTAVHAVHVHDLQGHLYITLHLEVGRSLSIEEGHQVASQLEDMLRTELPGIEDVDIHIEPAEQKGAATAVDEVTYQKVQAVLHQATLETTVLCSCHEVLVSRVEGKLHVSAHWECDPALSVEAAHDLTLDLERRVRERLPQLGQVVVHVEPRSS